jgi:hypothetical protein
LLDATDDSRSFATGLPAPGDVPVLDSFPIASP